jgi:hypothetical protein
MTQHPFKTVVEEFDAAYHKLRAHLLHALGEDGKQLEHEAEHDAQAAVQQAATDATHPTA